jgi:hypothetical protein
MGSDQPGDALSNARNNQPAASRSTNLPNGEELTWGPVHRVKSPQTGLQTNGYTHAIPRHSGGYENLWGDADGSP